MAVLRHATEASEFGEKILLTEAYCKMQNNSLHQLQSGNGQHSHLSCLFSSPLPILTSAPHLLPTAIFSSPRIAISYSHSFSLRNLILSYILD